MGNTIEYNKRRIAELEEDNNILFTKTTDTYDNQRKQLIYNYNQNRNIK